MDRICLFNRLIDILSRNCIPYAIVGRTEGYPKTIGSDIDIIIPRDKIKKFQESIWEFEDENTIILPPSLTYFRAVGIALDDPDVIKIASYFISSLNLILKFSANF